MRNLVAAAAVLCFFSGAHAAFSESDIPQLIAGERSRMIAEAAARAAGSAAEEVQEEAPDALPGGGQGGPAGGEQPLGVIVVGACAAVLAYLGYMAWRDRYRFPEGRADVSTKVVWATPKQLLRRSSRSKAATRRRGGAKRPQAAARR